MYTIAIITILLLSCSSDSKEDSFALENTIWQSSDVTLMFSPGGKVSWHEINRNRKSVGTYSGSYPHYILKLYADKIVNYETNFEGNNIVIYDLDSGRRILTLSKTH